MSMRQQQSPNFLESEAGEEVQDDFSKGLAAVNQRGDACCLADGGGFLPLDDGAGDVVAPVIFGGRDQGRRGG